MAETQRHAGHADVLRELIDGSAGFLEAYDNQRIRDQAGWDDHRGGIEAAAHLAAGDRGGGAGATSGGSGT